MTARVFIRTDIGAEHGMGNASRCRALAKALAAQGCHVSFVTMTQPLSDFVAPFACDVITTGYPYTIAPGVLLVIDTKAQDWATNNAWLATLQNNGIEIVRIDHPSASPNSCRLLIAPCVHWSPATLTRLRHDFCDRLLAGWDSVMLDDEVTSQSPIPYATRDQGPIVFTAGGSDPTMALERMAEWCADLPKDMDLLFATPQQSVNAFSIPPWGEWVPFSRDLLRKAALVIGFLGQTAYECLWYETPMLCFARAEDDAERLAHLEAVSAQAIRDCGCFSVLTASRFTTLLTNYWQSLGLRRFMSAHAAGRMDGLGVHRIASAILELAAYGTHPE